MRGQRGVIVCCHDSQYGSANGCGHGHKAFEDGLSEVRRIAVQQDREPHGDACSKGWGPEVLGYQCDGVLSRHRVDKAVGHSDVPSVLIYGKVSISSIQEVGDDPIQTKVCVYTFNCFNDASNWYIGSQRVAIVGPIRSEHTSGVDGDDCDV